MFAYVVKRLLAGVLVLFLVSMSIFLLFWYGPNEPARVMCDTKTSNRCNAERLDRFTEELGYNNAWYAEYGEYVKGVFVGRDITVAAQTYPLRRPLLRALLQERQAGLGGDEGAPPGDLLRGHRRRDPLPAARSATRGGRRAKTRHRGRTRPWSPASCSSARCPTTSSPC